MLKSLVTLSFIFMGALATADTFEGNTDRPGFDYTNFVLNNPRAILCQWSCQKDSRCRAWTYVKPGYQGPNARCWLKSAVPNPVKRNCCSSGIIQ